MPCNFYFSFLSNYITPHLIFSLILLCIRNPSKLFFCFNGNFEGRGPTFEERHQRLRLDAKDGRGAARFAGVAGPRRGGGRSPYPIAFASII
ncbi:hypothetical protein Hanom_Chr10g00920941 [Helianthus anomalus]